MQQVARIDFQLDLGSVTETIDVNAQAVLLDSESSTVGQVIGTRQISELPLLGRNPYALAMLAPGVRPSSGVNNLPIDQIFPQTQIAQAIVSVRNVLRRCIERPCSGSNRCGSQRGGSGRRE